MQHDTATGDYIITDVDGLHLTLRWRFDNQGYEVATSEQQYLVRVRTRSLQSVRTAYGPDKKSS